MEYERINAVINVVRSEFHYLPGKYGYTTTFLCY